MGRFESVLVPAVAGNSRIRRGIGRTVGECRRRTVYAAAESGGRSGVYRYIIGLRGGIGTGSIAHRQRYGIRTRRVVNDRRVLLGRTRRRTSGKLPAVRGRITRRLVGKLHRQRAATTGRRRRESRRGRNGNDHRFGDIRRSAGIRGGQHHRVHTGAAVCMYRVGFRTRSAVARLQS